MDVFLIFLFISSFNRNIDSTTWFIFCLLLFEVETLFFSSPNLFFSLLTFSFKFFKLLINSSIFLLGFKIFTTSNDFIVPSILVFIESHNFDASSTSLIISELLLTLLYSFKFVNMLLILLFVLSLYIISLLIFFAIPFKSRSVSFTRFLLASVAFCKLFIWSVISGSLSFVSLKYCFKFSEFLLASSIIFFTSPILLFPSSKVDFMPSILDLFFSNWPPVVFNNLKASLFTV